MYCAAASCGLPASQVLGFAPASPTPAPQTTLMFGALLIDCAAVVLKSKTWNCFMVPGIHDIGVGDAIGVGGLLGFGELLGAGELVGLGELVGAGELVGFGELLG